MSVHRNFAVGLRLRRQAYRQAGEAGGLCVHGLVNRSWRCAWKAGAAAADWASIDAASALFDLSSGCSGLLWVALVALVALGCSGCSGLLVAATIVPTVMLLGRRFSSDEGGDGPSRARRSSDEAGDGPTGVRRSSRHALAGAVGEEIEWVEADATMTGTVPWRRQTMVGALPQPDSV
eukprot:SAG31_NODE_1046_length_10177_cov_13.677218_9_plen_178_part_00